MNSNIKKETDSLDVFDQYSESQVEEKSAPVVIGTTSIGKALNDLGSFLNNNVEFSAPISEQILKPSEVQGFIEASQKYLEHDSFRDYFGPFMSSIIDYSYQEGYNNFDLDVSNITPPNGFLECIHATKKNPLKAKINGDVGYNLARGSHFLDIQYFGDIGSYCGSESISLKIKGEGNIRNALGYHSKNLIAEIKGNVGSKSGRDSQHMNLNVDGDVKSFFAFQAKSMVARIHGKIEFEGFNENGISNRFFFDERYVKLFERFFEIDGHFRSVNNPNSLRSFFLFNYSSLNSLDSKKSVWYKAKEQSVRIIEK